MNAHSPSAAENEFLIFQRSIIIIQRRFALMSDRLDLKSLTGLAGIYEMNKFKSKKMADANTDTFKQLALRMDKSNMAEVIERSPAQFETAIAQSIPPIHEGPFNRAIIAGMGGSALPAEIVLDAFSEHIKHPIRVLRNYHLPPSVDERCLVIVSSFSGNTEEALSVIKYFPKSAENIVVVCAGGRLEDLANERHYPLVRIPVENEPKGFQPRSATGYFVTYFARLLSMNGIIDNMIPELEGVAPFLRRLEIRHVAEDVAKWLLPRIPVVYTDETHQMSIARIAKIKFNENSKRPAFFNGLPEANHNEMIGFRKALSEFGILYLHDPSSDPRIWERFCVMRKVFRQERIDNVAFRYWIIPGVTKIQKIFAALIFADWCSFSLALLDGIDPSPVELVESFKNELESVRSET